MCARGRAFSTGHEDPPSGTAGSSRVSRLSIGHKSRVCSSAIQAGRLNAHVEKVRSAAEVYRSLPQYASPKDFALALRALPDGSEQMSI